MLNYDLDLEWKEFLGTQKLSVRTIKEYTRYFENYFSSFSDLEKDSLNQWIRKNNNNVSRAFIKKLIEFITEGEYLDIEEAQKLLLYKIPKIKGRKKRKEVIIISRDEVELLAESTKDKRLRLMILITYYCGLRRNELLNIRFKDFKFSKQCLKVLGKGNKTRFVPICERLLDEIIKYINRRPLETVKQAYKNNVKFFNRSGFYFSNGLSKLSKKVLGRHINPHLLRHSVSSYLRKQGLDLQKLKEFLGHEDINTTIKYSHLDKSEVKKDIIKAFN